MSPKSQFLSKFRGQSLSVPSVQYFQLVFADLNVSIGSVHTIYENSMSFICSLGLADRNNRRLVLCCLLMDYLYKYGPEICTITYADLGF